MGTQTGGSKKHWSFDPATVESVAPIRDALVHYDDYFAEELDNYTTLAIVMERIVQELPEEFREPVRLVHLESRSYRSAAKTLGIDHKTVKSRVERGLAILKARLVDSVWIAEMLRGYIPMDEVAAEKPAQSTKIADILTTLKRSNEQE